MHLHAQQMIRNTPPGLSSSSGLLKITDCSAGGCTVSDSWGCRWTRGEGGRTICVAAVGSPHDAARQHGTEAPSAPALLGLRVLSLGSCIGSCHASCWLAYLELNPLQTGKCRLSPSCTCWMPARSVSC